MAAPGTEVALLGLPPMAWMARLVGAAVAQQSLELLLLRQRMGPRGIWRWGIIRDEVAEPAPAPVRLLLDGLLGDRGFPWLLALRAVGGLALLAGARPGALLVVPLLLAGVLSALRFRGSENGGSDFMTLVVLSSLAAASVLPHTELVRTGCLLYVALQSCASYFIAGIIKLRRPAWRRGVALRTFLGATIHGDPGRLGRLLRRPAVAPIASWTVMLLEVALPLSLLSRPLAIGFGALALTFHVVNAHLFGLNRFVLAWAASWPAIVACAPLAALAR